MNKNNISHIVAGYNVKLSPKFAGKPNFLRIIHSDNNEEGKDFH